MKKIRFIFKYALGVYVVVLIFALFLYDRHVSSFPLLEYIQRFSNVVPFATFRKYIYFLMHGRIEVQYVLRQIAQNMLLFLPLGTLMPLCFDKFKSFKTTLIYIPCFFIIESASTDSNCSLYFARPGSIPIMLDIEPNFCIWRI